MARRFGSAMISKADSTLFIYRISYIRVKAYLKGTAWLKTAKDGQILAA